jgi:fructose-1,6-bisphosphatase/inositol monophosphatase family enzyme
LRETYTAVRGGGAHLNGTVIRPSAPPDLRRAVVSTGFPRRKTDLEPLLERFLGPAPTIHDALVNLLG